MLSTVSLLDDDLGPGPLCSGCNADIDEGSVIAFGDALFHFECFKCAKCGNPADCESNLLILTDGRPVCEACSYTCALCKQLIRDEAIMTGDEAYHASCFYCVSCKNKIGDLVFTTSKGLYCAPCHERRKLDKQRRREERERKKQKQYTLNPATKSLPSIPSLNSSSPAPKPNNQLRPITVNDKPYMSNRYSSRLFDAQMVTNYLQNEQAKSPTKSELGDPPTPIRSRSSSIDVSSPSSNSTQKMCLSHSRSETIVPQQRQLSPPLSSPDSIPTNKRLSVIPDDDASTSTLELALPSVNFSFFENDSAELMNLTKTLGANLSLDVSIDDETDQKQPEAAAALFKRASDLLESSLDDSPPVTRIDHVEEGTKMDAEVLRKEDPATLAQELLICRRKLADTEANYQKIKDASKRALDEFSRAREGFAKETSLRQQQDLTIAQLRQQLTLLQQAHIMAPEKFVAHAKEDIERLAQIRVELEKACNKLKDYRDTLSKEIELSVAKDALSVEIQSLRMERDSLKKETDELTKTRDEVIHEMIMLNTKNAELTNMNNDLSRRVTAREREAAAVMAGTSFLGDSTPMQRKSSESTAKVVSRDSFNGTQAPKVFKIKKKTNMFGKLGGGNKKGSLENASPYEHGNLSVQSLALGNPNSVRRQIKDHGSHAFQAMSFLRPVRCDVCQEKIWGRSELRCQGCALTCHAKCLSHVPQGCFGNTGSSFDLLSWMENDQPASRSSGSNSMFGMDLSELVAREERMVPLVVEKCIEAVEVRGMDYEGIYRKSGGAAQMRAIQQAFESGSPVDLTDDEEYNDICAVTSVLKHYFRQLPNPLLTFELYSSFIEASGMAPGTSKIEQFQSILTRLPQANYDTLKMLVHHLNRVRSQSNENLMTTKNLAMVFAPTLMRDREGTRELQDMGYKNAAIEYLINQAHELFP